MTAPPAAAAMAIVLSVVGGKARKKESARVKTAALTLLPAIDGGCWSSTCAGCGRNLRQSLNEAESHACRRVRRVRRAVHLNR